MLDHLLPSLPLSTPRVNGVTARARGTIRISIYQRIKYHLPVTAGLTRGELISRLTMSVTTF